MSRAKISSQFVSAGRALEWMGGVGVEEPAAVVAQLLDPFLRGDRPDGDRLLGALQGRHRLRWVPRLRDALPDEDKGTDDRDRQEDVQDAAGQIDPVVAQRLRAVAGQAADERDGHGQAGRRGGEVAHGEDRGLGQVRCAGLARVVLPVGVRLEADRCIEGKVRRHRRDAALVEGQDVLEAEHDVAGHDGDQGHGQDAERVALPVLLMRFVDPAHAIHGALNRSQHRAQEGALALHDPIDVSAQEGRDDDDRDGQGDKRQEVADGHR